MIFQAEIKMMPGDLKSPLDQWSATYLVKHQESGSAKFVTKLTGLACCSTAIRRRQRATMWGCRYARYYSWARGKVILGEGHSCPADLTRRRRDTAAPYVLSGVTCDKRR